MSTMLTCDYRSLKAAVTAALAVAGRDPYDILRFYPHPEDMMLGVAAASPVATVAVEVPLEFSTDWTAHVGPFDVAKQEAKALTALPIKAEDDELPMCGLRLEDSKIVLTDETGLGMNIRAISVRAHAPSEHLPNMENAIVRAHAMTFDADAPIHPDQAKTLAKVTAALKTKATVGLLQVEPGVVRLRATGPTFTLLHTAGKAEGQKDDKLEQEILTAVDTIAGHKVHVEAARPTGGLA